MTTAAAKRRLWAEAVRLDEPLYEQGCRTLELGINKEWSDAVGVAGLTLACFAEKSRVDRIRHLFLGDASSRDRVSSSG